MCLGCRLDGMRVNRVVRLRKDVPMSNAIPSGNATAIRVGDLVRIVKNHGCVPGRPNRGFGFIFRVERMEPARAWHCTGCNTVDHDLDGQTLLWGHISTGHGFYPMAWCRRIPPLEELDDVKRDEEVTA